MRTCGSCEDYNTAQYNCKILIIIKEKKRFCIDIYSLLISWAMWHKKKEENLVEKYHMKTVKCEYKTTMYIWAIPNGRFYFYKLRHWKIIPFIYSVLTGCMIRSMGRCRGDYFIKNRSVVTFYSSPQEGFRDKHHMTLRLMAFEKIKIYLENGGNNK